MVAEDRPARRRMSDEEITERMLAAAERLVGEARGLRVSLDHLGFEQVIETAEVARSSAYRVWGSKEDFYIELLCHLAGPSWQGTAAFDQETVNLASEIVAADLERLRSEDGRRFLIREAVRRAALKNFETVTRSPQWHTYVTLTATVISLPSPDRTRVLAALQSAEATFIGKMAEFYENMSVILGFKLRAPFESFHILAAVGAAVVEGLSLRQIIAPDLVERHFYLPGPEGDEDWSLPALGFMAILDSMIELDPEYSFERALSEYLTRQARGSAS